MLANYAWSWAKRIECAVRAVIELYCTDVSCERVSRRCSGIPSENSKSSPFVRWCAIPWAPTRLPLWILQLRCWKWRRCRRVSSWLSVVPPSNFPTDIIIEVFSSFDVLIFSLTLFMFSTYRSERLPRFRQVSVLHIKTLFWCNDKFWSLSKRLLKSISFLTKDEMFGVL